MPRQVPNAPDDDAPPARKATVPRVAPHSLDAEECLLGMMMLSKDAAAAGIETCETSDFYKPAHGHIFEAIAFLYAAGSPIDVVLVGEELKRAGVLANIGGPSVLLGLQTRAPATSSAPRYAGIVAEKATLRRLLSAATGVVDLAYEAPDDVATTVQFAREQIDLVADRIVSVIPEGLSTLDEFLERPEEEKAPWVIPGLLRRNWRVMVVAGEGAGKSVLLRQLGIAAAAGLHPFIQTPCPPVRVLIVDLENPDEAVEDICGPMKLAAEGLVDWDPDRCWLWRNIAGIDLTSRAGRVELEAVIRASRPEVVCLGPIYKTYVTAGRSEEEAATRTVTHTFDQLRTRYNFGLLLEHHAPMGESSKRREMRPHGSAFWMRWPELGIGLKPMRDRQNCFRLGRFRGDRLDNQWPEEIHRSGTAWAWTGSWPAGTFDAGDPTNTNPRF